MLERGVREIVLTGVNSNLRGGWLYFLHCLMVVLLGWFGQVALAVSNQPLYQLKFLINGTPPIR